MLITSSATRIRMSSSSARAISRRWSCPPLSWCGYLPSTSAGSRPTDSSDSPTLLAPRRPAHAREVRVADDREDAVGLEDRVVGAERVLEHALHVCGSSPAGRVPRGRAMSVPSNRDRPRRRRPEPQDHAADRALAAAALADQRDDLAGLDREADVAHGDELGAAERADPVASWRRGRARASRRTPSPSTRRGGRARPRRRAAARRTSRTRAGSGAGSGSRWAGRGATAGGRGCPASLCSSWRTPTSGSEPISRRVYGCSGASTIVVGRPLLGEPARVHDEDRVGDLVEDARCRG